MNSETKSATEARRICDFRFVIFDWCHDRRIANQKSKIRNDLGSPASVAYFEELIMLKRFLVLASIVFVSGMLAFAQNSNSSTTTRTRTVEPKPSPKPAAKSTGTGA